MRDALLAIVGAALIVAGMAMVFAPAGFITAGVVMIAGAYVARYLEVSQREDA